jgi:hypothetical protein
MSYKMYSMIKLLKTDLNQKQWIKNLHTNSA